MVPRESSILITGANGLVGSALTKELVRQGYTNLCACDRALCDLRNFDAVKSLFSRVRPDVVFHIAACVYGIGGNARYKGDVFLDNILMNTHVIEASRLCGTKKIVAMGTIAAYPSSVGSFVSEHQIWDGPPHDSENSYAHAKRAMLAQLIAYQEQYQLDFSYAISTNLYGPHDKFNPQCGHVIPSLIHKFYEAKKEGNPVCIWGDGSASRDFLYSQDMARALIYLMNNITGPVNVASGKETRIQEVVEVLTEYFGMQDRVQWEVDKPNGRKFFEVDLALLKATGFIPSFSVKAGLKETVEWFCSNYQDNMVRC